MKIGITGASGPLGRATALEVLRTVDPREVVLTTRHPEAIADLADLGAQVRFADFADPDSVAAAVSRVDRLLLVSTDAVGARLEHQRAAVEAAAAAGVSHIVYTSVPEPVPENPAVVVEDHAGTEQALRECGQSWTVLRNHLYAHQMIPVIEQAAATGRLITNMGAGRSAYVSREDCAAAAAAVLAHGGYEDTVLTISGPDAVGAEDLAALARKVGGGREVEIVPVDDAGLAEHLRLAGLPESAIRLAVSFGAATRQGFLKDATKAVSGLTGRLPTPLSAVVLKALSPKEK